MRCTNKFQIQAGLPSKRYIHRSHHCNHFRHVTYMLTLYFFPQMKHKTPLSEPIHQTIFWEWAKEHYWLTVDRSKFSDRENECKTVLIRKVTNFIEKNACRLVYTEHDSCSISWTYYILVCWPWIHFGLADQSGIRFSLWYYFWCSIAGKEDWSDLPIYVTTGFSALSWTRSLKRPGSSKFKLPSKADVKFFSVDIHIICILLMNYHFLINLPL